MATGDQKGSSKETSVVNHTKGCFSGLIPKTCWKHYHLNEWVIEKQLVICSSCFPVGNKLRPWT